MMIKDKNILTYEEARASLNVLEKRLGDDVELWKMFSKENIEILAGRVVITTGANAIAQEPAGLDHIRKCLARHLYGDFGDIKYCEDWQENILTVWTTEGRVLSRYKVPEELEQLEELGAEDLYIITNGIGSSEYHYTTIMLVSEY